MAGAQEEDHQLPAPGTLFAGRYRIERVLGVGGMGSVLLARHEVIGQQVALKLLHPEAATSPGAVERFVKEARAASKIEGQHVVRIYDVGAHEGRPYLCMEYLRGRDLGQIFDAQGVLPDHEVCSALLDATIALAQAHRAGIVHRDLKPSNLFFAEQPAGRPVLKVLDFGIAKMDDGVGSVHVTATGMIMGTPAYMAPEQMRSSKMVDARADIWALGVIAYELLTGRLPFEGDSFGDILFAVAEKPPPPPHVLRPQLDVDLSAVVMKCLQRDPDKRYATVTELSDALEPFATASRAGTAAALRLSISGELPSASALDLENAKTEQLHGTPAASPKTVSEWVTDGKMRPRTNARLLGGAGALVFVGVAVLVASRLHDPSRSSGTGGATASSVASASGVVPVLSSSATTGSASNVSPEPIGANANPNADAGTTASAPTASIALAASAVVSSSPPPARPLTGRPTTEAHHPGAAPATSPATSAAPTVDPHGMGWDGVPTGPATKP